MVQSETDHITFDGSSVGLSVWVLQLWEEGGQGRGELPCRKEYQGEPLEMEADTEAEEAEEEMEVLVLLSTLSHQNSPDDMYTRPFPAACTVS